jgi:two-component system chemotaxis sensor kinase CheA
MAENDILLEAFIFENGQLLEQLEELLLSGERSAALEEGQINETFRVMHTIKGSSAMMGYEAMASLAHAVEDLFSIIRENPPDDSYWETIFDSVLHSIDFFKGEIAGLQEGNVPDGNPEELLASLRKAAEQISGGGDGKKEKIPDAPPTEREGDISKLKKNPDDRYYRAHIRFFGGCQMETVRALGAVVALKDLYTDLAHFPSDLDQNCDNQIIEDGFTLFLTAPAQAEQEIREKLEETMFLQSLEFGEAKTPGADAKANLNPVQKKEVPASEKEIRQSFLSVNINKIDALMDLVGEIVTTESMVIKNPDLSGLELENFEKQARLLKKLTDELQDVVMSIRMVPVSSVFRKMQRIVRDMNKKIGKAADLVIIGEETEVDKNVLDNLSDPLMHLIRNAMDHGLETPGERMAMGKSERGQIILEARNSGGDVIVRVSDDGRGLRRDRIIEKAIQKGLTNKNPEEITDKEAFSLILSPGFSTKEEVTEFSGRGVGMDVVCSNINSIGGSVSVESEEGRGTTITMHIPLTLAILDGMKIMVNDSMYIIPIQTIRESLEPRKYRIISDPDENEMIMIRGKCFPIIRLHNVFGEEEAARDLNDGIMVLVESEEKTACLFADKLLGEQQAVVKPMPNFIIRKLGRMKGIAGCTILGDGSIARVLDVSSLLV